MLWLYCVHAEPSTQYVVSVRAINRFGKGLVVYDLVYTRDAPSQFLFVRFAIRIDYFAQSV